MQPPPLRAVHRLARLLPLHNLLALRLLALPLWALLWLGRLLPPRVALPLRRNRHGLRLLLRMPLALPLPLRLRTPQLRHDRHVRILHTAAEVAPPSCFLEAAARRNA